MHLSSAAALSIEQLGLHDALLVGPGRWTHPTWSLLNAFCTCLSDDASVQIVFTRRGLASASASALRALVASEDEFQARQATDKNAFDQRIGASSELMVRQVRRFEIDCRGTNAALHCKSCCNVHAAIWLALPSCWNTDSMESSICMVVLEMCIEMCMMKGGCNSLRDEQTARL